MTCCVTSVIIRFNVHAFLSGATFRDGLPIS
ncbi:UNVERIFIED_ORG: hypothetical protein M2312_000352 [Rhizobium esperanzae]|nr:hypothetical protein [Rhizobium esperanzae]